MRQRTSPVSFVQLGVRRALRLWRGAQGGEVFKEKTVDALLLISQQRARNTWD